MDLKLAHCGRMPAEDLRKALAGDDLAVRQAQRVSLASADGLDPRECDATRARFLDRCGAVTEAVADERENPVVQVGDDGIAHRAHAYWDAGGVDQFQFADVGEDMQSLVGRTFARDPRHL